MLDRALCTLLTLSVLALVPHAVRADVEKGAQLARQWCANCHVIGGNPPGAVPQGPPSFQAIARSGMMADQLRAFLSHPHVRCRISP